MKTKVTIWLVTVAQFAMSDRDLYNDVHATTKNPWATVWRNTDVPEELFRGEVRMIRQEFEVDVPIVLDAKNIRQIRIITNDD